MPLHDFYLVHIQHLTPTALKLHHPILNSIFLNARMEAHINWLIS